MATAMTALTPAKSYVRDPGWGILTVPEQAHRDKIKEERASPGEDTERDGTAAD